MPTLAEPQPKKPRKLLLVGEPGTAKTSAIASLANHGLEVFILDLDNGLDPLLHPKYGVKEEYRGRVHFKTITEKMKATPLGPIVLDDPKVYARTLRTLNKWKEGEEDYGSVTEWDTTRVLVLDSLSALGEGAMNYALFLNKRLNQQPFQSDWGVAMNKQEGLVEMLCSGMVKCHVLVIAHIFFPSKKMESTNAEGKATVVEVDGEIGLPMALGRKLPPVIGRYFNSTFRATTNPAGRRVIKTESSPDFNLKNPLGSIIPRELDPTELYKFFLAEG